MDKRELFAAVKEVRELSKAAGILEQPMDGEKPRPEPSESSQAQYLRIAERDWKGEGEPMAGVSRSSWFVHRAALLWTYRQMFRVAMQANDKAQKAGDVEEALEHVRTARRALERWTGARDAERPEKPAIRQPRASKRRQIPKGQKDWREAVHKAARPAEKAAVALLWATGLRPAELENGADVMVVEGRLLVQIPGAKVSRATKGGQRWRVIEVDRASKVGKALEAALDGDPMLTVQMGTRVLEAALERLGEELKHKHRLSAYTFRHQLGADLKAWKEPTMTAAVLGHRSERTQSWYGTSNQSKSSSRWIVNAEASRPIRGQRTDVRDLGRASRMDGPRI